MRHLVTVRKIDDIVPIEGADLIVVVKIDGWQCVAKKHEFSVGDLCVYFEIDSWIPHEIFPDLSKGKEPRIYNDIPGERLRTIKLRGQLSQGLALPIGNFIDRFYDSKYDEGQELSEFFFVGNDLTEFLGVTKYEAPIPAEIAGQVEGNFPTCIKKTDQERCQNAGREIFEENLDSRYEVSMKGDGTSFSGFVNNKDTGVCSRNYQLKINEENQHNTLVRMFIDSGMQQVLADFGRNLAVQAELMGPGIQGNRESFNSYKLFVFDIFDIDTGSYLPPAERMTVLDQMYAVGLNSSMVMHIPVLWNNVTLAELGVSNMQELLALADGPSMVHPVREGLVFKRMDGGFSFKAISNKFLLKGGD
jgi:RNA ligase (TIGR02306 family)